MIVEKKAPKIETFSEPKINFSLLRKKGSAKTASGLVLSQMQRFRKAGNIEMATVMQELYSQIRALEEKQKIYLQGWKGKSSFQVIKKPDKFIVITYQKPDQDSEPIQHKVEISKVEVNECMKEVIVCFDKLKCEKLKSRDLGERLFRRKWDDIFSDRPTHLRFNLTLRLMDYLNLLKYRGKFIYLKDGN